MSKKLYRSTRQSVLAGVCGGLAEYFNIDVTIVRLVWLLCTFATAGTGLLLYILAAIIIPKGDNYDSTIVVDENGNETVVDDHGDGTMKKNTILVIGIALIIVGGISLMKNIFPLQFIWNELKGYFWPVVLIAAGLLVIVNASRNR